MNVQNGGGGDAQKKDAPIPTKRINLEKEKMQLEKCPKETPPKNLYWTSWN